MRRGVVASSMLICPYCHTRVPHGAVVCRGCGAQAQHGCSAPGCGCTLSVVAGAIVWSVVSSTSAQLLKLILRPEQIRALPPWLSAVTQNRPLVVEIKGFKTSHSLRVKTALIGPLTAGREGHVECPESEPANDDIQFSRSRMVSAPDCRRAWDQP